MRALKFESNLGKGTTFILRLTLTGCVEGFGPGLQLGYPDLPKAGSRVTEKITFPTISLLSRMG